MEVKDCVNMFVCIFIQVYSLYVRFYKWLYPLPKQMFIYDNINKRVMVRGNIGYEVMVIAIDHFMVDGEYTIKINGDPLRCIKNKDEDGFRPDRQYFLTLQHRYFTVPSKVEIKDEINGKSGSWNFNTNTIVDFLKLIEDLDEM